MTDALVRTGQIVALIWYVTGQCKRSPQAARAETGISVIAVGHRRFSER